MIISMDAENTWDKYQFPFLIFLKKEPFSKVEVERNFFKMIKHIYDKPKSNPKLNAETFNVFHLRVGTIQRCSPSPFLINTVLKIPTT